MKQDFPKFKVALIKQFGIDRLDVVKWLATHKYIKEMNKRNESVRKFALDLFKHAKIRREMTEREFMEEFYVVLHSDLKVFCEKSAFLVFMGAYLIHLEQKQKAIYEKYSFEAFKSQGYYGYEFSDEDDDEFAN